MIPEKQLHSTTRLRAYLSDTPQDERLDARSCSPSRDIYHERKITRPECLRLTNEEFKTEALRIVKELMDGLDYADDYAQNRDGFTIFNNDSTDAYFDGEQFLKNNLIA